MEVHMNCCKEETKDIVRTENPVQTNGTPKKTNHLPHLLMMVLCCGLPLLLVSLVPTILTANPALGAMVGKYAFLLCPILMIPMLIMMLRGHKKGSGSPSWKFKSHYLFFMAVDG
jgi:hypothetical protein